MHRLTDPLVDQPRSADVVAILGRVADRVAHVLHPALIHQVDDELQLVQYLEIGQLRLISRVDQRLESGQHERADAAAEDRLLAEEIGLGLFLEGRLEHTGTRAAERPGIGERPLLGLAAASCWTASSAGTPISSLYMSRRM